MGSYATKFNICQSVPIGHTSAVQMNRSEKPTIKILMLGLDNAGKTTTALHLVGDSLEDIIPTIGFSNLELKKYEKFRVVIYDLGGGARIRAIWKNYFALIHGIIFVIDSSDISRVLEVKDVIEEVVANDKIAGKPILVLINKQDIEGALEELDICQYLKLESLINKFKCPTKVETCSANRRPENGPKIDPSIDMGYQWLLGFVAKNWLQLNNRVETDSNEQYSIERKSLEERVNRFREKRFQTQDNDYSNENEFIKNGNPFKAIEDVIRDIEQNDNHLNDRNKFNLNNDLNISQKNGNFDLKNSLIQNKESTLKLSSASEGEDTSDPSHDSNDSNDILINSSDSDIRNILSQNETSGAQQILVNNNKTNNKTDVEVHHNRNNTEKFIAKTDAKHIKVLKTSKSLSLPSPESSEKSITSNRSEHKKTKRKMKVIRNSKVSPDLSENS